MAQLSILMRENALMIVRSQRRALIVEDEYLSP
jgi:hypothetical protein